MRFPILAQVCVALLLAVSLVSVRLSGLHTHLCLDGQEASATLHMADAGRHEDHAATDQHQDMDVEPEDGLAKGDKTSSFDFIFIAAAIGLFAAIDTRLLAIPWTPVAAVAASTLRFIRPQLRAPPL